MNTLLWILQVVLAMLFFLTGSLKATQTPDNLVAKGMSFAKRMPLLYVRLIGFVEILGAIGLVLPWLTNLLPVLTPLAACGLALIMTLAAFDHFKHQENKLIIPNIILFTLSIVVALGRFGCV